MSTITSANTSINKTKAPAIVKLVEKVNGFHDGQHVFDFGCGKYPETTKAAILDNYDLIYAGFDPYNRTSNENSRASFLIPMQHANVVLCSNVLNVIQKSGDRRVSLVLMRNRLQKGGILYLTVYEGNKSGKGKKTKEDCWQENRPTQDYVQEIENVFGKGNVTRKGKLIIATKN